MSRRRLPLVEEDQLVVHKNFWTGAVLVDLYHLNHKLPLKFLKKLKRVAENY